MIIAEAIPALGQNLNNPSLVLKEHAMTIDIVIAIIACLVAIVWRKSPYVIVTPVAIFVMYMAAAASPLVYASKLPAVTLFICALVAGVLVGQKWWSQARPKVMKFIMTH